MQSLNTSVHFLHIYAKPKSYADKIEYWINEGERCMLQLRITAPPEGGKANKAIIALLAKTLGVPKSSITLVSGATAHRKIFKITAWSTLLAEKLPKQTQLHMLF